MQLTTIRLSGFKSFADLTDIPVHPSITSIAGPNGCGKSNIVDAVRWVIGEISAKQLRGAQMTDVIFSGTQSRKPVGRAFVELIFDNTAGRLGGLWAAYSEIAVRREVSREGQSQYAINGTRCRRRDVLDVFLGTGLGPRSYAIIEQGMISRLIDAKPRDLRVYFEEVAGVSKYKERRRETENRLARTKENLDRVNDLREELDKQLRHLKRQANASKRYREYQQQEKTQMKQIKALQWKQFEDSVQDSRLLLQRLELQKAEWDTQRCAFETNMSDMQLAVEDGQQKQLDTQKQAFQVGEAIARLEENLNHQQTQITEWRTSQQQLKEQEQELEEELLEYQSCLTEYEAELSQSEPEQQLLKSDCAKQEAHVEALEVQVQQVQCEWDAWQQARLEAQREHDQSQGALQQVEKEQERLDAQKQRCSQEKLALPIEQSQEDVLRLSDELTCAREAATESDHELQTISDRLGDQRAELAHLREQQEAFQKEERELQTQEATLRASQDVALAQNHEHVQAWLETAGLSDTQCVGEIVSVTPGWEKAVEVVLKPYLSAVCVSDWQSVWDHQEQFHSGSIVLCDRDFKGPPVKPSLQHPTLADYVEGDSPFKNLLSRIYAVTNLSDAQRLRAQINNDESVIVSDGTWLSSQWVQLSGDEVSPDSGVFERSHTLKNLVERLTVLQDQIQAHVKQLHMTEDGLRQMELRQQDSMKKVQQAHQSVSGCQVSYQAVQQKSDTLLKRRTQLETEHQSVLQQEQEQAVIREQALTVLHNQGSFQDTHSESRAEEMQQHKMALWDSFTEARHNLKERKMQWEAVSEQVATQQSELAISRQKSEQIEKALLVGVDEQKKLAERLEDVIGPRDALQSELKTALQERKVYDEQLSELTIALHNDQARLQELSTASHQISENIEAQNQKMHDTQVNMKEVTVRQATLQEQISELSSTLDEVLSSLPEEAVLTVWEEELERLKTRIQRLGPINLAAWDEYQQVSQRQEYIQQQFDDLMEAVESLQKAIRKIDQESKTRFMDMYNQVNQEFQKVFPQIFRGGIASLELTEDDLLEAGVMVKAQPPGKRNASIQLLSGGEKALTALALVFSFFSLNPAPFCILDEVDAPLDDLNTGRFIDLVRSKSDMTQFLVISHNKATLSTADHLLGITMQEPGVSRLVSVNIEEAVAMVDQVTV